MKVSLFVPALLWLLSSNCLAQPGVRNDFNTYSGVAPSVEGKLLLKGQEVGEIVYNPGAATWSSLSAMMTKLAISARSSDIILVPGCGPDPSACTDTGNEIQFSVSGSGQHRRKITIRVEY